MNNTEIAIPGTYADACITRKENTSISDGIETHGQYHAQAYGPLEIFRKIYMFLRDKIADCEKGSISHSMYTKVISCIPMELKWADAIENTTTHEGRHYLLDTFLAGSTYTAAWYIGLISLTSYTGVSVDDTAAAHGGWIEDIEYSETVRQTASWSIAAGGSKSLVSACVFSINGDGTTIKGCFLTNSSAKSSTGGYLYSAGLFAGGDKVLANGDTLNVSYTATVA